MAHQTYQLLWRQGQERTAILEAQSKGFPWKILASTTGSLGLLNYLLCHQTPEPQAEGDKGRGAWNEPGKQLHRVHLMAARCPARGRLQVPADKNESWEDATRTKYKQVATGKQLPCHGELASGPAVDGFPRMRARAAACHHQVPGQHPRSSRNKVCPTPCRARDRAAPGTEGVE